MSEIITTYMLTEPDQPMPMDRDDFYNEQVEVYKKTGKPTRAIEIVQLLLFAPQKEIILQKRSKRKMHNPNMLDKSIGGHITFGDTPNFTILAETLQELEVPSLLLSNKEDFAKTYKLLKDYINKQCLIQYIDSRTYNSKKIINKEEVRIANKYNFYLGIYAGSIRPADRESSGVVFYDMPDLEEDMAEAPNLFTEDLKFFLNKYRKEIREFLDKF